MSKATCDCGAPSVRPGSYWRNACTRCAALEASGERATICGVPEDLAARRRWQRRRGLLSMERVREVGDACDAWLRERGLEGAP